MTIHEAEKEGRETHRQVRHKTWPHFIPVINLMSLEIPIHLALSNEWEVEPLKRLVTATDLRRAATPVLRKYISGQILDEALKDLQESLFKGPS